MTHNIDSLPVLVIYAHTRCNCRCVMCDIWKTPEHQEFSLTQLEAQLPAIERLGVQWVVFSGGEPLMHSDLFALTRRLRDRRIRVTILTTGLLLERNARQVVEDVDDVIVSLDGPREIHDTIRRVPGTFDALARGVAALHTLSPQYPVSARCTVQKANHASLIDTAREAHQMGLASISFLAADTSSTAFGRGGDNGNPPYAGGYNPARQSGDSLDFPVAPAARNDSISLAASDLPALKNQIERLKADPFVADSPRHLDRVLQHFQASLGLAEYKSPHCNAPWVSAVIETDGRLRPCFFHPVVAGTTEDPLDQALNSPSALAFRQSLDIHTNPTCRRCVCSLFVSRDPS